MKHKWLYKARDPEGKPITGVIEGESKETVFQSVAALGLIPTGARRRIEMAPLGEIWGNFGSANKERLIIFTRKLKTLYSAGIPLLRALTILEHGAEELGLKAELAGIREQVQSGLPLSRAMEQYPKKFPPIYVASIAAGEASGTLDEVLEHLSDLIEKELVLARQLKTALRYPFMVITAIAIAVAVILTFVVPRFVHLYSKFGADLPLPTRIVISVSTFFSAYWYVLLAATVFGFWMLRRYISTDKGKLAWDKAILKIPIVGDLAIKANIARFAAMLKSLYSSGVPMVACMNILRETAGNQAIAVEIGQMAEAFEKGQEIGLEHNKTYKYFPGMALEMFRVGLEAGSVETIMDELARHYEMELAYRSRHLTAILEPILTVLIGGMVLLLALSVFLPMWNLIKVFR